MERDSNVKLLWFNWRDIRNPEAGGAEVVTHEIAKRMVRRGYHVTLFSSMFQDCRKYETIDNVNIIREGGRYTVYNKARNYYGKHRQNYDIIIDEINVKPFLTPKFVKEKPIVALIYQISPEQFLLELPFPLSYLGYYFLEKRWLERYRDIMTVTISNSTRKDLEHLGFKRVVVVPIGVNTLPLSTVPNKESYPSITYIGRLKRHKLPDHALVAFSLVKREIPDVKLWVIGDGYMRRALERKFNTKDITFFGRISAQLKFEMLGRTHLVMVPATREGWALVVTESNSVGTPAVAYNVPGLRDSVKDGETGVLTDCNSPECLARSVISLLKNREWLYKLSHNALSYSKQFSWEISTDRFEEMILQEISRFGKKELK